MDLFFPTSHLDLEQKRTMLLEAKEIVDRGEGKLFIDIKDEHYRRIPREVSFEVQMEDLNNKCHFTFYIRDGYLEHVYPYIQITFCTLAKPPADTFLWIEIPLKYLSQFEQKYNLKCKR